MRYWRESEFVVVDGVTRYGTCGPCALAMAESASHQVYTGTADCFVRMRAAGRLADAQSGASTIGQVHDQAAADGMSITAYRGYAEPWPDYPTWLNAELASGHVVVLEVANGQALHDEVSGKGENAVNLHYHYIAVLYQDARGYWCADGDNFAVGDVLQCYTVATLAAARPCAGLALAILATPSDPAPPTAPGGSPMPLPTGWSDDGTSLTGPASPLDGKSYTVRGGFRVQVVAALTAGHWRADDMPLEDEHPDPADAGRVVQTFNYSQLRAVLATGDIFAGNIGADLTVLEGNLTAADNRIAAAQAQVADLTAQLAAAQAEIATLKAAPAPAALTSAQEAALTAIAALRVALG